MRTTTYGGLEGVLGSIGTLALDSDLLTDLEVGEVNDGELVRAGNEVVVLGVLEPEGKHTGESVTYRRYRAAFTALASRLTPASSSWSRGYERTT